MLKQLDMVGLVELHDGIGSAIKSLTPFFLLLSLSSSLLIDRATAIRVSETRLYIKRAVVALGMKNAIYQDIKGLQLLWARKEDLDIVRREDLAQEDFDFHLKLQKL
jgi:DNA-binding FadR family transcriptional regulator